MATRGLRSHGRLGGYAQGRDVWVDQTSAVGSFPPNTWGLYDMHGNIFERTQDCYESDFAHAPVDGSASTEGDCSVRVFRSGTFESNPCMQRSRDAGRLMQQPLIRAASLLLAMAAVLALPACTRTSDADAAAARRMADREQVEATLQRYLNGLDRLDAELYANSFTPDGVMFITGTRHQGRDEMRAIVAQEAALRQSMKERGEPPRTLFHLETNSRIEFSGPDQALHSAYWLTVSRNGEGPAGLSVIAVGSSTDELRRVDGHWLISRREIRTDP